MSKTRKSPPMTLKPQHNQSQLSISATAVFDIDATADGSTAPALPKFRMVAYTGGPMRVAGWRYPVIIDLAGLSVPSQARPIRFGHDPLSGVGHTDAIRVEGGQLIATGIVSRDTPAAREVVVSSKNGFPWQASVGAGVDEFEFVKDGQKVTVNGTQYSGPVNVVRKSSLGEISFVDLGADGATSASVAAQASATPGEPDMDDSQTQTQDDPNAAPVAPVAPNPATPEPATTQPEVRSSPGNPKPSEAAAVRA